MEEVIEDVRDRIEPKAAVSNMPPEGSGKPSDPNLLQKVYERMTREGASALSNGKPLFKRREVTFTIDGAACLPEVFVNELGEYVDVTITMHSLTSTEEINAMAGAIQSPETIPYSLAKNALHALNGTPIKDSNQRDFLWEALGPGGRSVCMLAFNEVASASQAVLGKYQASLSYS